MPEDKFMTAAHDSADEFAHMVMRQITDPEVYHWE